MVTAAKKASQVATHIGIGFIVAYAMTGSAVLGGLATLLEPIINVLLLPIHGKWWAAKLRKVKSERERYLFLAGEKISQTALHSVVAFSVMYGFTGSMAVGGLAALLEPMCNVVVLPLHDRLWDTMCARFKRQRAQGFTTLAA